MTIKIIPNDKGNPPGKLADAEIWFTEGPLTGLRLIGFAIWERRGGGDRNVTFPARQYSVNGERRAFALLRPTVDTTAQDNIRAMILQAYEEYEALAEQATKPANLMTPFQAPTSHTTTYCDRAYATPAEQTQADQDEQATRNPSPRFDF